MLWSLQMWSSCNPARWLGYGQSFTELLLVWGADCWRWLGTVPCFSHVQLMLLELELWWSPCWHVPLRCHWKNEATSAKNSLWKRFFFPNIYIFLSHTGSWEVMLPLPRCVWDTVHFADSPSKAACRLQPSDSRVVRAGAWKSLQSGA